jgi:exonuclease III
MPHAVDELLAFRVGRKESEKISYSMRMLTWNCNGAFRIKYKTLEELNPDICIIQECEDPNSVSKKFEDFQMFSKNNLWLGSNKNKGLGVFAKSTVSMKALSFNNLYRERKLKWFIPIRINDSFNLLAVWNHQNDSKAFAYIGQFWQFMRNNKSEFKDMVIGGDFNSNAIWDSWDRWWNHSDCVKELAELNISSV